MLIQSLAGLLAAKYCQILQHDLALKAPENREMKKCNIADICQYIEERHGVGISLEHMARMMHFSKFHFHRIFRSATGVTLHQYYCKASRNGKSGCLKRNCRVLGFHRHQHWFWRHRAYAPDKENKLPTRFCVFSELQAPARRSQAGRRSPSARYFFSAHPQRPVSGSD